MRRLLGLACLSAAIAAAQTFDAASVKLVTGPSGGFTTTKRSGPVAMVPRRASVVSGRSDPGRFSYAQISIKDLVRRAYPDYFEIRGPGWMDDTFVSVEATMPPDTSKDQLNIMLRNLIVDRFGLAFHAENSEMSGYALVVARNGLKLKPAAEIPAAQDASAATPAPPGRTVMGADGFTVPRSLPEAGFLIQSAEGERSRMTGRSNMEDFAVALGRQMRTKVVDSTGLKEKYDIMVTYAGTLAGPTIAPATGDDSQAADPLPDIFRALESQLGLKLEAKKIAVPVMVVDRMERTPREN